MASYVEEFRRAGHQTVDWIAEFLLKARELRVLPDIKPGDLMDALPASAPEQGESFDVILRDFQQLILPAVTQWNHPRFFAYFACTGSTPSILGEMLAAALNTNGIHWLTSPAVAELEHVTLDWLRQWMGLPDDYTGFIYDTASVSTLHAIAAAREMADPDARVNGSTPKLTLYTSDQSHSSVEKDAIALGIGQSNVRKDRQRWRVPSASGCARENNSGRPRGRQTAVLHGGDGGHDLQHQHRSRPRDG